MNSGIYTPYGHLTDEELLREAYFTDKTLTPLELELLKRLEEHIQAEGPYAAGQKVEKKWRQPLNPL